MSNLRELTELDQDKYRIENIVYRDKDGTVIGEASFNTYPDLSKKDSYKSLIVKAMQDANSIQEFLWDDESWSNKPFDAEEWSVLFQKRVDKIKAIDTSAPNWKVEVRKRLLQQASLSLKAIMALQENNI